MCDRLPVRQHGEFVPHYVYGRPAGHRQGSSSRTSCRVRRAVATTTMRTLTAELHRSHRLRQKATNGAAAGRSVLLYRHVYRFTRPSIARIQKAVRSHSSGKISKQRASPPTRHLSSRLLEASPIRPCTPLSIQRCHGILWLVAHQLDKPSKIARECGNRPFRSHYQYQLCI